MLQSRCAADSTLKHDRSEINTYKIFVGNLEWKRILGIPRRTWQDSMTVVLRETGYDLRN
jgi:hypothetical protein